MRHWYILRTNFGKNKTKKKNQTKNRLKSKISKRLPKPEVIQKRTQIASFDLIWPHKLNNSHIIRFKDQFMKIKAFFKNPIWSTKPEAVFSAWKQQKGQGLTPLPRKQSYFVDFRQITVRNAMPRFRYGSVKWLNVF